MGGWGRWGGGSELLQGAPFRETTLPGVSLLVRGKEQHRMGHKNHKRMGGEI